MCVCVSDRESVYVSVCVGVPCVSLCGCVSVKVNKGVNKKDQT